jgi:hypothetical protein
MAKQREEEETVSGLSSLLGTAGKRAVKAHSGDEVRMPAGGFIDLPAGVNGVAQLASFKLGKYKQGDNKGKPFWMATGVVVSPKTVTVDGEKIKIEGARTKIGPNPLCETTNSSTGEVSSLDDKIDRMLNELRKFGVDTSEMGEPDDIEQGWLALVEEAPYFNFSTWSKKKQKKTDPDPIVNETWKGIAEDYETGDDDDVEEFDESELDAEAADSGDEEAQLAIANYAKKFGIDASSEDYQDYASVMEAVEKVQKSKKGSGKNMAKKAKAAAKKPVGKKKQLTNAELGAIVDAQEDGYEEAGEALSNLAGEYDLDPDEYPTWEELGQALDEATNPEDEEVEYEEEEEAEEEEELLGPAADEGDKKAIKQLTAMAEEAELDPDDYETWTELEEALSEGSEEEEEESEEEEEAESTYEELGELADDDDEEAQAALTEAAEENELDPDDFKTWTELGMELDSLGSGEEEEEEEESEEFIPEKGETYSYKPEGQKKAFEVEVTFVNTKAETVTVKNAAGKIFKNVPFGDLQG